MRFLPLRVLSAHAVLTGSRSHASNWSAARAIAGDPRFSWAAARDLPAAEPVYFTGEMVRTPGSVPG